MRRWNQLRRGRSQRRIQVTFPRPRLPDKFSGTCSVGCRDSGTTSRHLPRSASPLSFPLKTCASGIVALTSDLLSTEPILSNGPPTSLRVTSARVPVPSTTEVSRVLKEGDSSTPSESGDSPVSSRIFVGTQGHGPERIKITMRDSRPHRVRCMRSGVTGVKHLFL